MQTSTLEPLHLANMGDHAKALLQRLQQTDPAKFIELRQKGLVNELANRFETYVAQMSPKFTDDYRKQHGEIPLEGIEKSRYLAGQKGFVSDNIRAAMDEFIASPPSAIEE